MRVHQTDTVSLEAIRADRITSYLIKHGWKRVPFRREGLLVFEGPEDDDGEPIIQVIPRSERASDFAIRARELVDALSVIEDRPVEEILRDIAEASANPTRSRGRVRPWARTPIQYALSLAATAFGAALLLFMSAGLLLGALASHAPLSGSIAIGGSIVLADVAVIILFRRFVPDHRPEAVRGLLEREVDLAAAVRRLGRELARIGQGATHSTEALTRAFALSLVESIKHGDEWLRIKSIDALAELAGADQIIDIAEPVLARAAADGSSQAVRAAAVRALSRFRGSK